MSQSSNQRSEEFLKIADQFKLGVLTTESSHPVTAELSQTARQSTEAALGLLFEVDKDVVKKFEQMVASGCLRETARVVVERVRAGGKVFFTGCGSTGRLSIQLVSIWRDFWQRQPNHSQFEDRAFSVMAGGDFALIKAVEGFEDYTAFGKRQIRDLGVGAGDVVFAITEGGETSFVIGTAWQGLESGAKVYFVYNNPDDVLCQHVQRSREVIQEPRIEKINLTTGPMAITGSTRMQATSIQLAVMLTVLEIAVRELRGGANPEESKRVPEQFLKALREAHNSLCAPGFLRELATLVQLEEAVYRTGKKNNYYADRFGIDVLTDTTERSPTYCTPPFRKYDDQSATESWAFLFVPYDPTPNAWRHIIKRDPRCVEWSPQEVLELVGPEKAPRTSEIIAKIGPAELMRFRVGIDGLSTRLPMQGASAICIVSDQEQPLLLEQNGFFRKRLEEARAAGAGTGIVWVGSAERIQGARKAVSAWDSSCKPAFMQVPDTGFLLDGVTRVALKMALNALSTCTMVQLGRVMGNYMIWVVASNLKLIDRATRYIQRLTGLEYKPANQLLFEVVEYVEPRMKSDQAYPPVVGLAVTRVRHKLDNAAAEAQLWRDLA
jgi:N-acetylmuramic acid 6-phosphate etherase